ncbi:Ig-like domain-containing protein [Actinomyces glycerinitolerans]|uniref:Fibronectin type iii n=1 Tax=Actinomyces glycerinitolerans TaxID=1892869 RepID=A0A1M4RY84_9ACTO|nr:Ig-like domain-containing protein [Actinomyces glycerinitolerans]SHE24657.1 fibronectin type iii [Actinomyces glycerinitolerans]
MPAPKRLFPRSSWPSLKLSRRRRRGLSAALAGLAALCLGTAAWLHDGVPQADVSLNDGGVWVTSTAEHLVARLNYPSKQVDGSIRTASADFDVTQSGEDVLVPDLAAGSVAAVDPTAVALSTSTQLTGGTTVLQGADRVFAVDAEAGTVSGTTVDAVDLLAAAPTLIEGMPGVVAVAGTDGSLYAVSSRSGTLTTVPANSSGWGKASAQSLSFTDATDLAITAVGDRPVVLERGTGIVHLPDGTSTDLGTSGLVLQQPGPSADAVLVASRTAIMSVPLDGSPATTIPASADGEAAPGVAAQPVRLGDCVYGAWSGSGQFLRQCGDDVDAVSDDALASSSRPVFRVNRDAIVLNDITQGTVWLPDENLVLVEDWTDITSQTDDQSDDKDESAETSDAQSQPERTEENHPPQANDDTLGVRPGRSTVLQVLANDSDPDGDVLSAEPGDTGTAQVTSSQSGLALRIDVPEDATGTYTVPYTASDGRGGADSAVAAVEVHDWSVNNAPEQISTPTLVIAADASGSLDVLGNWLDPDGDTLYLVSAQGEGFDVRTTNEGTVTVRDMTGAVGTRTLTVVVSDGQQAASGTVTVDVQSADSVAPIANADHVLVVAGTSTVVSPLDNDVSPTGDPLSLAGVEETPAGTSLEVNQQAGTFTFSAEQAGTYYVTYDVTAGSAVAQGIVRADVVEPSEPDVPPVTENDTVLLREGGSATVAPLNNDFDPAGGVLVLQSASAPDQSGVSVTVVDHSLLQVSAPGAIGQSVEVEYTASNGTASATGHMTVVPVTTAELQVPIASPDSAVVRVGDVVTVSVLDNDTSPSGLALSVADELGVAGADLGTAWTSGDVVRFKADDAPGRTTLSYTVSDTQGQSAFGQIDIEVRARDDAANAAPVPQSLEASTVAGSAVAITVPLDGIDPDGDSVSLVGLAQTPTSGTVEAYSTYLTYTPHEGATGTDTFTYTVEDRFGAQATGTVRVGVAAAPETNTAPVATDDLVVAQPGRTVVTDVVSNDFDADGDTLAMEDAPLSDDPALTTSMRSGRAVADLPGTEGVYTAHYRVADGRGGMDVGTITYQVLADAPLISPIGVDDYVTVDQVDADGMATVSVLDNDQDADGSPWDLTVTTADPTAEVVDSSIRVSVGDEQRLVLYTITDQDGLTGNAVIVIPSRDDLRPRLDSAAIPVRIPADTTTTVDLADYILTRVGTTPTVADDATVRTGTGLDEAAVSGGGGSLDLTPAAGFSGQTSVTLTVTDSGGDGALSSNLTLPVVVEATGNTPPGFTPTEVIVAAGEDAVTVDLSAMTQDADGDELSFSIGSAPAGFTASLSGSTVSVSAEAGTATGTTGTLPVTVDDGNNDPVIGQLPLRVSESTQPLMTTAPAVLTSDGSPVSIDVSTLVTNPFPDQPITLSGSPQVTSGTGNVTTSGTTLTITPGAGFAGRLVVRYEVLDATGSASRAVTGTVTVTVTAVPNAPTGVSASPSGATAMKVSWVPGADNGSAITGYTVTEVNGAGSWRCAGSPCAATGLTAGGTYSFQVVATNAAGDSAPSAASAPVTLTVTPDAPTGVSLTGGNGSVTVSWGAATPISGVSITYEVQLLQGGNVSSTQKVSGTSATFGQLNPGSYTARVRAVVSGSGQSAWATSAGSASVYGAPGKPGTPSISWDGSNLNISWTAAANNGDAVSYTVAISGSVMQTVQAGTNTSVSVPVSLGAGTHAVSVTVTAANQAGSATSTPGSKSFRITGKPSAPSAPVAAASGTTITITQGSVAASGGGWDAGELEIEYRLVDAAGNQVKGWDDDNTSFSGLTPGATYYVEARTVVDDDESIVSATVRSNAITMPNHYSNDLTVNVASGGWDYQGRPSWWNRRVTGLTLTNWAPDTQVTCQASWKGSGWEAWPNWETTLSTTVTVDSSGSWSGSPTWKDSDGRIQNVLLTHDLDPAGWFGCN